MRIFINTAALKSRNDVCYHCFSTQQSETKTGTYFTFTLEYIYSSVLFGDPLHDTSGKDKGMWKFFLCFIPCFSGKWPHEWLDWANLNPRNMMSSHTEPALQKTWFHQKNPKLRMAMNVTEHGLFLLFHIQVLMVHCGKTTVNSADWLNWDRY